MSDLSMGKGRLRFSFADILVIFVIIAMACAVFRMEQVITRIRSQANKFADEQQLLAPPRKSCLAVRAIHPPVVNIQFRIYGDRKMSLWCDAIRGNERHLLAEVPAGEHLLQIDWTEPVQERPASLQLKLFTGGQTKQIIEWPLPNDLRIHVTRWSQRFTGYTESSEGIKLTEHDCIIEKFHLMLRPQGW